MNPHGSDTAMMDIYPSTETGSAHDSLSPTKSPQPKQVSFELLLLPQSPQHKARLPMRVNIYPHDTTDSIITTVKNFYGLYERKGVVFEDRLGNTLIARYENFAHNMVVYVRVTAEDPEIEEYQSVSHHSMSPRRPRLDEAFQMLPPSLARHMRQSESPQPGRGRRSASTISASKRARAAAKSRGPSSHRSFADANGDANGYSDSENGDASVSSRRSRKEQVASAEISVDNIVEGGRRKRAKFDSSRRISGNNAGSPYAMSNQQTFAFSYPLASPQSYGQGDTTYMHGLATPYSTSSAHVQGYRSRTRGTTQGGPYRQSGAPGGILPTPDPTLGSASVISDEDVARQLMRLGDASNFSTHGRTSTSTLDDALSGKAEVASSSEESDDGSEDEQELPPLPFNIGNVGRTNGLIGEPIIRGYESADSSGEDYDDNRDDSFKGESDEIIPDGHHDHHQLHVVKARGSVSSKSGHPGKPRALSKPKSKVAKAPMSPTSLPSQSRKTSSASTNGQPPLGLDEEDLSSKPRCQRCRKSKKGCDRQRPCGRCKDAGIGIEGCVSEDEGNGRKGRYGRHMGVPVKKPMDPPSLHDHVHAPMAASNFLLDSSISDKNKKRKR
ncbi:hypothetical protein SLS60_011177 [Paraconiothyrium brasiliense]|uniref:Zn(2)-C6 fungal-type domain-containing protein n=1 Tax=Paraconiothyrium brasiliense TaxID=300254 RepID=A0ABR3QKT3_9PLEO